MFFKLTNLSKLIIVLLILLTSTAMSIKTVVAQNELKQTNKKDSREQSYQIKKLTTDTDLVSTNERFFAKRIAIVGNTVFPESELKNIIFPFEKKEITLRELLLLKTKITNRYIEQGYISSGAFIPVQEFTDGEIVIQIVEGSLEKINISGLTHINEEYIYSRLPKVGEPLKIDDLRTALNSLQTDLLIKDLNARLEQPTIGTNILFLKINENKSLSSQFALTNGYSPSIGAFGGIVNVDYHLFGLGDILNFQHTKTEGLSRISAGYSFPIDPRSGNIFFNFMGGDTDLIEQPISALDIQANLRSYQLGWKRPIASSDTTKIEIVTEFDLIQTETFINEDFSFAFVEGLEDGKSRISALRFVQEVSKIGQNNLFKATSQFSLGIDLFDSTITDVGRDSLFWSWQGGTEWILNLNPFSLISNLNIQLTGDRLLPLEQMSLGGINSVRGYRKNLSLGDNGIFGSIGLKLSLLKSSIGNFSINPFIDAGTVWNNSDLVIDSDTLASIGFGLTYELQDSIEARIDYGIPLIQVENAEKFSESQRINFVFSIQP